MSGGGTPDTPDLREIAGHIVKEWSEFGGSRRTLEAAILTALQRAVEQEQERALNVCRLLSLTNAHGEFRRGAAACAAAIRQGDD